MYQEPPETSRTDWLCKESPAGLLPIALPILSEGPLVLHEGTRLTVGASGCRTPTLLPWALPGLFSWCRDPSEQLLAFSHLRQGCLTLAHPSRLPSQPSGHPGWLFLSLTGCHWFPSPSSQAHVSPPQPTLLSVIWASAIDIAVPEKNASTLPQDLGLICKTICTLSLQLISRKKASAGPLGLCPPQRPQSCSSASLRALSSSSHWSGGLGRPSQEEAGLVGEPLPQSLGPSGICLIFLLCLLAPDTPQAGSSPSTPPTSFPPPEAEVTASPGLGGAVITCQLGKEASSPHPPPPGAVVLAIE